MESLKNSLINLGLSEHKAAKIDEQVSESLKKYPPEASFKMIWPEVIKMPFPVQLAIYKAIYPEYEKKPAPAWFPDEKMVKSSNIAKLMA